MSAQIERAAGLANKADNHTVSYNYTGRILVQIR